ncbi:MAG: DUF5615 family PIN-like protein [Actinobacteria bacterium]|nr:DUF5615 family PIN-like protein [Actinomycetota bacterium]
MQYKNLKFLVDVGVGKRLEEWLKDQGYDLKSIRDIDPRMLDKEILKVAVFENRMVITMDKDFGELVFNSRLPHGGVLLLRLEDAKSDEKIEIMNKILDEHSDKLLNKFCVYKNGRLRIRK